MIILYAKAGVILHENLVVYFQVTPGGLLDHLDKACCLVVAAWLDVDFICQLICKFGTWSLEIYHGQAIVVGWIIRHSKSRLLATIAPALLPAFCFIVSACLPPF